MARRGKSQKVNSDNWLTVNPFKLDAVTVEELRRKGAKQANQRLVRLEHRKAPTGESLAELGVAQYAYEQIKQIRERADVRGRGSKGRFREQSLPLGESQARMELYAIQQFLSEQSSRAGTAAKFVSKTQRTFEEAGVSVASYKSFYNFLNSRALADLKAAGFSSDDIVDLIQRAKAGEDGEKGKSWKAINAAINEFLKSLEEEDGKGATIKDLSQELGLKPLAHRVYWKP